MKNFKGYIEELVECELKKLHNKFGWIYVQMRRDTRGM